MVIVSLSLPFLLGLPLVVLREVVISMPPVDDHVIETFFNPALHDFLHSYDTFGEAPSHRLAQGVKMERQNGESRR